MDTSLKSLNKCDKPHSTFWFDAVSTLLGFFLFRKEVILLATVRILNT